MVGLAIRIVVHALLTHSVAVVGGGTLGSNDNYTGGDALCRSGTDDIAGQYSCLHLLWPGLPAHLDNLACGGVVLHRPYGDMRGGGTMGQEAV